LLKPAEKLRIKNYRIGKHLKTGILIIILWSFALLSGFSPSVIRAALMFSFIAIGQSVKRQVNIYNSIAASAFVILIFDPVQLSNVSFQLSYSAVLSIVFFQPKIAGLLNIKSRILRYIWSLTAVSLAAQIGTFPITLFYFNSFPKLFLMSNLIVIPTATLIIYTTIMLLFFSFIPYISDLLAYILKHLLELMRFTVNSFENLPFAFTDNIPFSNIEVYLSYALIVGLTVFILKRNYLSLCFALTVLIIWSGLGISKKLSRRDELIIYNIQNETAINIISGTGNYLLGKDSLNDKYKIKYGPMPYWLKIGLPEYEFISIESKEIITKAFRKSGNLIAVGEQSIVLITDSLRIRPIQKKLQTDLVILSENTDTDIRDISEAFDFKLLIIDSSNDYKHIRNWRDQCRTLGIDPIVIRDDGAYITNLKK
jgi:competence protein ComEC